MNGQPYHVMPTRLLVGVWGGLMGLLILTYLVAHVDLGPLNLPVALAIALAKTLLVLHFFMELKDSSRLVHVFASTGFYWLAILVILGLSDFLSRGVMLPK